MKQNLRFLVSKLSAELEDDFKIKVSIVVCVLQACG